MHTLIIKSNSSYGRSEYIAIILSLKWHFFSPCFIHEIYKGLCKLMGLIWFNRGERDFYSIWTFSMNTLHLKQSLSGVDTASSDTAILQSKTQSIPSDYLLSFLESRDLSQNKMFLLMSFSVTLVVLSEKIQKSSDPNVKTSRLVYSYKSLPFFQAKAYQLMSV